MTPRSLFTLLIKICGVYFIIDLITILPNAFSSSVAMAYGVEDNFQIMILGFSATLLALFLFFLIIRYCILHPDRIIDKLSLDKHFTEEKFEFNMHRSTVLSIVIMLMGLWLIIQNLPDVCRSIYTYFGDKQQGLRFGESPTMKWLIFYFVKALIGYMLFTNHRFFVNLIERQRKR